MSKYKLQSISNMLAASRNLFGNVSLIKHMRMARFNFARPLVRVFYFVLIGAFIVLCFIAFLVLCVSLMCCYCVDCDISCPVIRFSTV